MSSDAVGDEEAVRVRRHRLAALVIQAYETAGTMEQDFIGTKRDTIATKAH